MSTAEKIAEHGNAEHGRTDEMQTITETMVINPAFLQEIKDSNPDCWDVQHRLRQLCHCDSDPADRLNQVVKLLDAFRDHLALQFALEESYGYQTIRGIHTKTAVLLSPGLIDKAHDQHCGLYLEISELSEQACDLQYRGFEGHAFAKLIKQIIEFNARLVEHEQLESELIEQSFDLQ